MELEEKTVPRPEAWPQFTFHAAQRLSLVKFAFAAAVVLLLGIAHFYTASAPSWLVAALGCFLALSGIFFGLLDCRYQMLLRNGESALQPPGETGRRTGGPLEAAAITGLYAVITLAGLYFAVLPFFLPMPAPVPPVVEPLPRPGPNPVPRPLPPGYPGPNATRTAPNYYNPNPAARPPNNRPFTPAPRPNFPPGLVPGGVRPPNPAAIHAPQPAQTPQTPQTPALPPAPATLQQSPAAPAASAAPAVP